MARGFSFGTPGPAEVELAEEIVRAGRSGRAGPAGVLGHRGDACPRSGWPAGSPGAPLVVKFAGCYHGHVDSLLVVGRVGRRHAGPAGLTRRHRRAGRRHGRAALQRPRRALEALFAERGGQVAAVITEAAAANMGVVPPEPGFNAAICPAVLGAWRPVRLRRGDDRVPGRPGGALGADGRCEGWAPDLFTFGKVMGGGLPAAAFGGRADVMGMLAPAGPVYQAGTLAGNPIAATCGLATLRACDDGVYARLDHAAARLCEQLGSALAAAGVAHRVQAAGNLFSVFFTDEPVRDYAGRAPPSRRGRYRPFFHAMLDARRVPAAVGVRGLVRLGGARRRRPRPGHVGAARRGRAPPRPPSRRRPS